MEQRNFLALRRSRGRYFTQHNNIDLLLKVVFPEIRVEIGEARLAKPSCASMEFLDDVFDRRILSTRCTCTCIRVC